MRSWLFLGASAVVGALLANGCGSGTFTASGSGASVSTSSGQSSSGTASGTGGAGTGSSGTGGSGTGGSTGTTSSGTTSSSGSAPCPDELGAYSVAGAGAGCGDLAAGAPQCIQAGGAICQVQLVSQGPAGSALNGTVDLDMSGNFANGAVKEGTVQRTGCTGMWNAVTGQLTVDCGGVGSSQSCIATLTRTGKTCSSSSSSSGGGACPDELGAYTVMVTGAGCSDLTAGAPQCIKAGSSPCQVQLVSQGSAGAALNGTVDLDMAGSFANGAITEGTVRRTGCTGTWNSATSQLTVDCGGVGSSQSCIATLTRTGNTCP
jgi:hypothetical protein